MFAGHIGAALAIARVERRVNVGLFIGAALLLDVLLWIFVLLGWESVSIPGDFAITHQPEFIFPRSHGLAASLAWAFAAAAAAYFGCSTAGAARWRIAALIGAAVFSHWVLDALVHRPELPIADAGSPLVGLGLWNRMPLALALEGAIVLAGLWLFTAASALPRRRLIALASLAVVVLLFTVAGMTIAPPPPSPLAMAVSSLATLVIVCALACWLGRRPG
jgi:hypothetical protein